MVFYFVLRFLSVGLLGIGFCVVLEVGMEVFLSDVCGIV